ncbi:MAG: hypothetical protein ACTH58_04850 [Marinomonas foliarum]|uniref:hypothetical protein n=1 Tax=Marinomonas foliarum TaxID=491950 RepID=UPI003F9D6E41
MKEIPTITVGELLDQLEGIDRNARISFSGLDFYRIKRRGPDILQIEFNQQVYLDESGRVVVENHQE